MQWDKEGHVTNQQNTPFWTTREIGFPFYCHTKRLERNEVIKLWFQTNSATTLSRQQIHHHRQIILKSTWHHRRPNQSWKGIHSSLLFIFRSHHDIITTSYKNPLCTEITWHIETLLHKHEDILEKNSGNPFSVTDSSLVKSWLHSRRHFLQEDEELRWSHLSIYFFILDFFLQQLFLTTTNVSSSSLPIKTTLRPSIHYNIHCILDTFCLPLHLSVCPFDRRCSEGKRNSFKTWPQSQEAVLFHLKPQPTLVSISWGIVCTNVTWQHDPGLRLTIVWYTTSRHSRCFLQNYFPGFGSLFLRHRRPDRSSRSSHKKSCKISSQSEKEPKRTSNPGAMKYIFEEVNEAIILFNGHCCPQVVSLQQKSKRKKHTLHNKLDEETKTRRNNPE